VLKLGILWDISSSIL